MESTAPSWDSVNSLIEAGKKLSNSLNDKAEKLIEQSNALLSPFQDPLCLDLSTNRWFAGRREEGYSDWLVWIIEQIDDPELVFKLLGINDDKLAKDCKGITPELRRELYVEEGHEGQAGRIDIIILYKAKILIDVEVKVTNAESADIDKNAGYRKSLEKMYPEYKEKKYHKHKLLVTKADKPLYTDAESDDGYEVLKWMDVCLDLRHCAGKIRKPLLSALMLAFAGAVEQNLLGIQSIKSKRVHSESIDYLRNFLSGGTGMDKNDESTRFQLVKDGLPSYLDAQWAIHEFQKEIIKQTKEVVINRLEELSKAMNLPLKTENISDFMPSSDGDYSNIGCNMGGFTSGLNSLFFCLVFERSDLQNQQKSYICVSVYTQNAGKCKLLLAQCKKVSNDFAIWDTNEIGLAYPIESENFSEFKVRLNALIDKWIEVWKNADEQFRKEFW